MDVRLSVPDAALGSEWRELAERSLAASGHNAPELLLPAFKLDASARLATVSDGEGLELALALTSRRLPLPFQASLSTPINFYGLPHVGRYQAASALEAVLRHLAKPLLLHAIPVESAFWEVMTAAGAHLRVLKQWERAVLRPNGTYASWLENTFEPKRRREYRRQYARLSEQGKLEALTFGAGGDAKAWAVEFLDLEAKGWKGRRGTALKSIPGVAETFAESLSELAAAGKLRFWKLQLDSKPIAMLFAIVEGKEAWLGKIGYDESLARFSPGVQVVLQATDELFAEGIIFADSCASADNPLMNPLWRGRMRVADVMIASANVSRATFAATAGAEHLRRRFRAGAKTVLSYVSSQRRRSNEKSPPTSSN
jgi:CelD/BcsL family acetyltransferase involved in cellulose biosynthesis